MRPYFLSIGEIAIFRGNEGEEAFVASGPCREISDAWNRATAGYDAEHIWRVIRCDPGAGTSEDVTDECADALAHWFASEDPVSPMPSFVKQDQVDEIAGRMACQYSDMRMQGVA